MKTILLAAIFSVCLVVPAFAQHSHADEKPAVAVTELNIEVEGGKSVKMKTADFAKLQRRDLKAKDHDGNEATFSGFELREILAAAGAKFGKDLRGPMIAQYLVVEAADGYRAVFSLTELEPEFSDKTVILADQREGKALAPHQGTWQVTRPLGASGFGPQSPNR